MIDNDEGRKKGRKGKDGRSPSSAGNSASKTEKQTQLHHYHQQYFIFFGNDNAEWSICTIGSPSLPVLLQLLTAQTCGLVYTKEA